jgi:hypothetical protein
MMADYMTRSWLPTRAPADMALPSYRQLVPLSDEAVHADGHGEAAHDEQPAEHADEE